MVLDTQSHHFVTFQWHLVYVITNRRMMIKLSHLSLTIGLFFFNNSNSKTIHLKCKDTSIMGPSVLLACCTHACEPMSWINYARCLLKTCCCHILTIWNVETTTRSMTMHKSLFQSFKKHNT